MRDNNLYRWLFFCQPPTLRSIPAQCSGCRGHLTYTYTQVNAMIILLYHNISVVLFWVNEITKRVTSALLRWSYCFWELRSNPGWGSEKKKIPAAKHSVHLRSSPFYCRTYGYITLFIGNWMPGHLQSSDNIV